MQSHSHNEKACLQGVHISDYNYTYYFALNSLRTHTRFRFIIPTKLRQREEKNMNAKEKKKKKNNVSVIDHSDVNAYVVYEAVKSHSIQL